MRKTATAAVPRPLNVDATRILLEELKKLGDPLPPPVAKLGPSGLFNRTMLALQKQAQASGKDTYTESDFRSALRQAIRELTDTTSDNLTAAARRHTAAINSDILAAATEQVLQEQGKADDYSGDEYLRAVAVAKRRTGLEYGPLSENAKAPAGTDAERGRHLHVVAEMILARDGARLSPRGELIYTAAEYAQALHEAAEQLTTA
jgi:ribosomal protein S20